MAIGIDNNLIVGPHRAGPRNQRRTPLAANTALYPTLMWNSRFAALSGDPFDNSAGLQFPPPEGLSLSDLPHLLVAQAFIPPTERVEVAGFDFPGDNDDIRHEVLRRLNASHEYRQLFGRAFPQVAAGAPMTFEHFAKAIAEFEFTLVFANAPLDRFARGQRHALTVSQKRGALLFFGKAKCVQCHSVAGESNEMFSDFRQHVIGVPQIVPAFGNVVFDGPGANEDFGLEQVTGNPDDRYLFRTAPLRNAAVMPAFMHNGAFVHLEDAIRHHLDPYTSARHYTPRELPPDLQGPLGPIEPVLARLDPLLQTPIQLSDEEFSQLVDFVRHGLLDPRILPRHLRPLVPKARAERQPDARLRVRVGDQRDIAGQRGLWDVSPKRSRAMTEQPPTQPEAWGEQYPVVPILGENQGGPWLRRHGTDGGKALSESVTPLAVLLRCYVGTQCCIDEPFILCALCCNKPEDIRV